MIEPNKFSLLNIADGRFCISYHELEKKYGVNRTTINKRVLVHQGIHDLPGSHKHVILIIMVSFGISFKRFQTIVVDTRQFLRKGAAKLTTSTAKINCKCT